jgi:hypothetical protein
MGQPDGCSQHPSGSMCVTRSEAIADHHFMYPKKYAVVKREKDFAEENGATGNRS